MTDQGKTIKAMAKTLRFVERLGEIPGCEPRIAPRVTVVDPPHSHPTAYVVFLDVTRSAEPEYEQAYICSAYEDKPCIQNSATSFQLSGEDFQDEGVLRAVMESEFVKALQELKDLPRMEASK
jgi:hypothetical protein